MSWQAVKWVLHEFEGKGNQRLILIVLAEEADEHGRKSFPSLDRIAHHARIGRRTVVRVIPVLEQTGALIVRRPKETGKRHNIYELPLVDKWITDQCHLVALVPSTTSAKFDQTSAISGNNQCQQGGPLPIDPYIDPSDFSDFEEDNEPEADSWAFDKVSFHEARKVLGRVE